MLDSKSIKLYSMASLAVLLVVSTAAFFFFRLDLNSIPGNGIVVYHRNNEGDYGTSKLEIHEIPNNFSELNDWYSKSNYSIIDPFFENVKYQNSYCMFEWWKFKQYHVGFLMINNQEQIDSLSADLKDDKLKYILKTGRSYFIKSIFREHLWGARTKRLPDNEVDLPP